MPDHLTILGVALSLLAALFLGRGSFLAAGLVLPLAGLCDILDGDVARERGMVSPFGAFLDSTLDRVSEGALYVGLAYYYFTRSHTATVWMRGTFEGSSEWGDADGATLGILALAILILSFLVSYRSEEHTSELQSRFDLVCRLLLEKKNCIILNARHIYEP